MMDTRDARSGSHDVCNFTHRMKLHLLLRSSCCLIMKIVCRLKCHLKRIKLCIMQGFIIFALLHSHFRQSGFPTSILLHRHCHFVNAVERKFWITLQLKELTYTGISCAVLSEQKQLIEFSSVPTSMEVGIPPQLSTTTTTSNMKSSIYDSNL